MFYSNYPSLDLHGENRDTSRILVDEFIKDNYKLGNYKVIIVHGIGSGIVKEAVHIALKNNKLVKSYKVDNFNIGCTIVDIDNNIDFLEKK